MVGCRSPGGRLNGEGVAGWAISRMASSRIRSACSLERGPSGGVVGQDGGAVVQQPEQRHRQGGFARAVAANQPAHGGQVVAEPPAGHDDHPRPGGIAGDVVAQRADGQRAEDHREVVDGLDGGVGVVHRRATGPCRPCRRVAGCRTRRPVPGCVRSRCGPTRPVRGGTPPGRGRGRPGWGSTSSPGWCRRRCVRRPGRGAGCARGVRWPAGSSSSGCTVCRYPDLAAVSGTAHGGGVGAVSSTVPIRPWTTARVSCSTRLPIASTWMEWARWSAKYTTMARLANISTALR